MVISAVPKTQLTLSLSSSNLLISGHSAKAYSHSALDRLSRYRVRNKLTFQTYFHYFLYLNLRVGWWAIQILSIPNYSILQLSLASLSSYSQGACPSHSTHVANPNFGTRYRYPPFPPFPPLGYAAPWQIYAVRSAARIGHERLPVGLSYWLCLPTLSTFPRLASRSRFRRRFLRKTS